MQADDPLALNELIERHGGNVPLGRLVLREVADELDRLVETWAVPVADDRDLTTTFLAVEVHYIRNRAAALRREADGPDRLVDAIALVELHQERPGTDYVAAYCSCGAPCPDGHAAHLAHVLEETHP